MSRKLLLSAIAIVIVIALVFTAYQWSNKSSSELPMASTTGDTRSQQLYVNLPYTEPATDALRQHQTLDLYLPEQRHESMPLLVFIPGGFWAQPAEGFLLSQDSIEVLTRKGIAVAQLRFRHAPDHPFPAQIEDVASAVAFLANNAGTYGYQRDRIFVMGHSSGGQLASLLAQDDRYLGKHDLSPRQLAGVIVASGILDVSKAAIISDQQANLYQQAFGDDADLRTHASPVNHIKSGLPPLLMLSAEQDLPGFGIAARRYTDLLREAGNKQSYHHVLSRSTHLSELLLDDKDNRLLRYLLAFMKVETGGPFFSDRLMARRFWHDPPISTEDFWQNPALIDHHPVDERFVESLFGLFQGNSFMLTAWPLQTFHAIDLYDYLEKTGQTEGNYLITNNLRDERLYLDLEKIRPYKPVIVVGLDDEKNLFKLTVFYQTKRQHSWLEDDQARPLSVRPLGAFLYFLETPPAELQPQHLSDYSLSSDSFKRVKKDPLDWLWQLPEPLHATFTYQNGCVSCHAFKGMQARSHHTNAMNLNDEGGFALPLTSYPTEVWREFVFNQAAVAEQIGVFPNSLPTEVQQPLFDLVEKEKSSTQP